jgi:RNA polymerase sigma-70 factor (ECF subfamily)
MNEALLIENCRRQDSKAQHLLFDSHADALLPICIRYLKSLHDAEDAMLRGFEKFFRNVNQFEYRGEGSVRAFLRQIVIRECLMSLRQEKRLTSLEEGDAEALIDSATDILSGLSAKEIFRLISELPDGYRTVFNLFEVEQYTHEQIASELGLTVGTSKSQLSKAKALLRKRLQQTSGVYGNK